MCVLKVLLAALIMVVINMILHLLLVVDEN